MFIIDGIVKQYIEGDIFSIDKMDYQKFKYLENNNKIPKIKLPVEIEFEFENNNKYYSTNIVLPNDFEKYFKEFLSLDIESSKESLLILPSGSTI